MIRKLIVGIASFTFAGGIAFAGPAGAEGGNGASLCSFSGTPDGIVDINDVGTWDNPGEVTSYFASQGIHWHEIGTSNTGFFVLSLCHPSVGTP